MLARSISRWMKWSLCATFLCVTMAGASASAEENVPPEGFKPLFNGKDLVGWHGMGHFDPRTLAAMSDEDREKKRATDLKDVAQHWTVDNGELVNDGHGVYLTTDQNYGDIELWIDYKTVAKADSGIYLRGTPQVQIWDFTEEGGKWKIGADKGSGGLWNNSAGAPGKDPTVLADKPFGEWNRFRILQVGERTTVYLNDKLVVDHARMENFWSKRSPNEFAKEAPGSLNKANPLFRDGPIQLQTHGGEIRWRNVFVREIPTDEANEILATKQSDGFESVFNGKDFDGWQGPIENYEVVNGNIKCKKGKGGTIYTSEEYADFSVRLEFLLPEGGNNGLAIRYPGSGNTAYVGMCELQILDNKAAKYAKLDQRQYHGSAYGIVPAYRGYLRPAGEWNVQQVTVQGSRMKVELNGTLILDADLAEATQFMADSPHPGKDRKSGHFGFAGHNDPVQFRNIKIKKL
jgi:3-keto-disaccharide hydrolase